MTDHGISVFGPDFPFPYDQWVKHSSGTGTLPDNVHGAKIAIIGAGMSGLVAGYELMKLGLAPIIYEAGRIGGRVRSQPFAVPGSPVAELGGMRFPRSATTFNHYADILEI